MSVSKGQSIRGGLGGRPFARRRLGSRLYDERGREWRSDCSGAFGGRYWSHLVIAGRCWRIQSKQKSVAFAWTPHGALAGEPMLNGSARVRYPAGDLVESVPTISPALSLVVMAGSLARSDQRFARPISAHPHRCLRRASRFSPPRGAHRRVWLSRHGKRRVPE
jgi:hypothetical protein